MDVSNFQHFLYSGFRLKWYLLGKKNQDKSVCIVTIWQRTVDKLAGQHSSELTDPYRFVHGLCRSVPAILEYGGRGQDWCCIFELKVDSLLN